MLRDQSVGELSIGYSFLRSLPHPSDVDRPKVGDKDGRFEQEWIIKYVRCGPVRIVVQPVYGGFQQV